MKTPVIAVAFLNGSRPNGSRRHETRLDQTAAPHRRPAYRSLVPPRRIFFCNSKTPYSNASAVGGQPGT